MNKDKGERMIQGEWNERKGIRRNRGASEKEGSGVDSGWIERKEGRKEERTGNEKENKKKG